MRLINGLLGAMERRRSRNWTLTVEVETADGPIPLDRALAELWRRTGITEGNQTRRESLWAQDRTARSTGAPPRATASAHRSGPTTWRGCTCS